MTKPHKRKWTYERVSCLIWTGRKDDFGYGRVEMVGHASNRAHRIMYETWYGVTLQPEDVLLHSCDNPSCINPHHLTKGTQLENVQDMDSKGRRVSGNALKTHCPWGHEYTPENTVVRSDGKRRCRTCLNVKRTRR